MKSLPKHPDEVKFIFTTVDPRAGNYAAFVATDHTLITIPVVAGQIDPFDLFYAQGEIDHPDAVLHDSGFLACFLEDSIIRVPLKALHGWPFPRSVPADFSLSLHDFDEPVEFYGIGATDVLMILERPAQPGEISQHDMDFINTVARKRERDKESDQDPTANPETTDTKKRHLRVVPAEPGPAEVPEAESRTPPIDRRSVGRTRKFAWIPPRIMEPMEADGLSMLLIEIYRILYTYRKYPEKSRIRIKGKAPLYPPPYTITYQSQIANGLKVRKSDLLATARGPRRNQARKMGTSPKTVKRAIHRLCEAGWIARVYPGRPKDCPWLSPQAQERRDQRHERVPQWGPQKYLLATDKYQRDGIKGLNRKLRELGLPPYLIYLPGPRF